MNTANKFVRNSELLKWKGRLRQNKEKKEKEGQKIMIISQTTEKKYIKNRITP